MTFRQQFQTAMVFLAGVVCACFMMDGYIKSVDHQRDQMRAVMKEMMIRQGIALADADLALKECYKPKLDAAQTPLPLRQQAK